tara:strand:- start:486 stop:749 length:264 start_codon:yes stop_codon:yes gene_type:complete
MAKARVRNIIINFLKAKHQATTHEIYDHVNQATKHGVTMAGLSNLLSKDKSIEKDGTELAHTVVSRYQGSIWRLRARSLDEGNKMEG